MTALKYTDRDVRERPELVAEAVRYLRWYQGEFQFLVDAKHYLDANGNLPLATTRGVLNCMRSDARYALVAGPFPEPLLSPLPPLDRLPVFDERPRRHRLRVVKPEPRLPFPLKTHWNARLMYSSHKTASVVHALRLGTPLWYYPEHRNFDTRGVLRSICSTNYTRHTLRLARRMPEGKRFCRRCAEAISEFGYDWGPTIPPPIMEDA